MIANGGYCFAQLLMKYGRPWFGLCNPNSPIFSKPLLDWRRKVITVNLRVDVYSYNFDTKLNVWYIFNYAIKLHNLSHWNEKGREKSENTLLRKGDEENYLVRNYFSQFLFNDIFLNASGWIIPRYEKITYQSTRSDSRIAFEETRIENALSRTPSPTPCTLFLVGGGVISSREKIPFDTKIGLCQWTRMIRISSFLEILHVY